MNKLVYQAPELKVLNIFTEGVMPASLPDPMGNGGDYGDDLNG